MMEKTKENNRTLVPQKSRMNNLKLKKRKRNSDPFLIVQIILNGKRKTGYNKAIKSLLSLEVIQTSREPSSKEVGYITLMLQALSLT